MAREALIFILMPVILAAAAAAMFFHPGRTGGYETSCSRLQGEWVEMGSSSADRFTIEDDRCLFTKDEKVQKSSFTVSEGENYALNLENTLTVKFRDGEGPAYSDEYIYHTQQADGHTIRILDSFLYEDDGRGLIVSSEFVHSDDLQYIGTDFTSDLYDSLNGQKASPSYMERSGS